MTNPKGSRHERSRLDWLRDQGVNVVRVHDGGTRDEGDLRVGGCRVQLVDGRFYAAQATYAVQCKDWRDLAGAINKTMRDLPGQVENAGADFGFGLFKRFGKPDPADDLVIARLEDFIRTGLWL